MQQNKKVSIIVPIYREVKYLSVALDSLIKQRYKNWEAIIVDDGSFFDDSIIDAFSDDNRFLIYHIKHGGVSLARNFGIEVATGEIVAFLDSDDLWLPDKLSKQIDALNKNPDCGLVYCDAEYIDSQGSRLGKLHKQQLNINSFPEGSCTSLFCRRCYILPSTAIIYKSIIQKSGVFDPDINIGEDWIFFFKASLNTSILCIQEPLVLYRRHSGSVAYRSHRQLSDRLLVTKKIFNHPQLPSFCKKYYRSACAESFLNECTYNIRHKNIGNSVKYFFLGFWYSPISASRWLLQVARGLYFKMKMYL
jgi:glycosyltransferase involved in cell wall biosynthesis